MCNLMRDNKLKKGRFFLLGMVCMFLLYQSGWAQEDSIQAKNFAPLEWYASNGNTTWLYSKTISVSYDQVPLEEALVELANQAGVRLSYNQGKLPEKSINFSKDRVTVIKAFKQLFEDTELEVLASPSGQIVIKEKNTSEVPPSAVMEPVSGQVIDANSGETLPGVNLMVKGTTRGTATDADGTFSLDVPSLQDTLVVSYIGYQSKEVPIAGQTNLEIALTPEAVLGDELVVVGYGTQEEANITGSIDEISGEDLDDRAQANVGDLLQGTSPNLNFSMGYRGGEPGSTPDWNIRGMGSISGDDSPLILVDGVEMNPNNINPNDIESVSVLKDASASAIYGSRGAFGVILMTTKKGSSSGDPSIQYSNNLSFDSPIALPHQESSLIWATAFNQAARNAGEAAVYSDEQMDRIIGYINGDFQYEYDPENPISSLWSGRDEGNANYDWPDEFTKDFSFGQKHNLSVNGGGEDIQYFLSAGYNEDNGIYNYGYDYYKRYNFLANLTTDVTDWLSVDLSSKFIQTKTDYPIGITTAERDWFFLNMMNFSPMTPKYNINGTIQHGHIRNLQDAGRDQTENNDFWLNLSTEIEPVEGWLTTFTYNYNLEQFRNTRNPQPVMVELGNGEFDNIGKPGTAHEVRFAKPNYRKFNVRTSYENTLESHYFKAMVGFEQEDNTYASLYGRGSELITTEVPSISTSLGQTTVDDAQSHWATRGIFGRLNYNYDEKYLIEISGRYNGSSRFAEDDRWGLFPSGAVGYRISEEDFWEPVKQYVNFLKLRASYGSLGNQQVANYLYLSNVSVQSEAPWIIGGERPPYANTPGLISNNLTWETITTTNVGFDAEFLDNRLDVTFDWFHRKTSDMIGPSESLPGVLGTSAPEMNNATLETRGYEIALRWNDRLSPDFSYNVRASLGDNKTTILEYKNENGLIDTWYEGKEVGEIWGYKTGGIIQSEGEEMPDQSELYSSWGPGDMKYVDLDGDGAISEGSRTLDDHGDLSVIGNTSPRYNIGLQAGFNWKWFDFSMLWQGVAKRDYHPGSSSLVFWGLNSSPNGSGVYEGSKNLDYWRPEDETGRLGPNTDAYFPKPYFSGEISKNRQTQSKYVLDASYLRLRNLRIGYSVPNAFLNRFQIQRAKIYFAGSNLLTLKSLPKVMDPETAIASEPSEGGYSRSGVIYPISRTLSVGVNLEF